MAEGKPEYMNINSDIQTIAPLGLVILAAGIGLDGNAKDSLPPLYP